MNMSKIFSLVVGAGMALCFVSASAQDSLTPRQRIELLPLPENVSVERDADISKDPIVEFSKQHYDFAAVDPFATERRKGSIPKHTTARFTTLLSPRDVYLFFKRFVNTESVKTRDGRTLPFYNSWSYFSFDEKNEADVTLDKTIGAAVFYRIELRGGHGRRLDIIIFNDGKSEKTTVYIIALDEKA